MRNRHFFNPTHHRCLLALTLVLFSITLVHAQNNTVHWSSFSMGFATSASSTTVAKSLIGQAFSGTISQPNTTIEMGFLANTMLRGPVLAVANDQMLPTVFALQQNYPNPFNPTTTIRYELPTKSLVILKIFNILGQEIGILVNEEKPVGVYQVQFDAAKLPNGVYFYRLQVGEFVQTKKLMLLK